MPCRCAVILVEREADAFPCAAIDQTARHWIVMHFTACVGPVFLSPAARVPADDRKRDANFGAAYRVALREEIPPVAHWARA